MNQDFDGQTEAEDFLGLEGEVNALAGAYGEAQEVPPAAEGDELGLAEGWLLEVSDDGSSRVATHAPDVAFPAQEGYPDHEDGAYEGEFDAEGDDYPADGEELFEEEVVAEPPRRMKPLIAVGFVAGIAIAAGLFFLDRSAPTDGPTDLAARVIPRPPVPATSTLPVDADAAQPSNDIDLTAVAGEGDELAISPDAPPSSVLDGLLAAEPVMEPASDVDGDASEVPVGLPVIPDLGVLDPSDLALPTTNSPRSFLTGLEDGVAQGDVKGFMEFETNDTGLIWTGMEVPFDAIARPGRLLTPAVGVVRATMLSGETFEGHLYAVGGQRVWIEVGAGRIGLDGERVSTIERLQGESPAGIAANAALPGQRVRVRTAGGVLYGQVKSREGNRVTILTDKGARISLVDPVIEPIGRLSELVLKP